MKAIEINPYAFELAQVSVQIGYLQWRRDNGFDNDRTPVLQVLDGFQNEDALLVPHFHSKAKTLKEAQAGEHTGDDDALKFYTEREWPKCDVIVSNPPFLGGSKLWEELGRRYQQELWRVYEKRVPGAADLCCYWFEKAREQIEHGRCKRAGLLATQGIRGGVNRDVLKRIKETGDIFFAVSDRDWILDGANVHVSMIGLDDGSEDERTLDERQVEYINANLTSHADIVAAKRLASNSLLSFQGSQKIGAFEISEEVAFGWLAAPNPHGAPNSDVVKISCNGLDLARRSRKCWMIDFGTEMSERAASLYEKPFQHVVSAVKQEREKNNREAYRKYWWRHGEPRIAMRSGMRGLNRFVATPEVSKHALFAWLPTAVLPDKQLIVFATEDDFLFGVLVSRTHAVWAFAQGTQLREKESGFRYTPTTCFETFPFPFADDLRPPAAKGPPPAPDSYYAQNLAAKNYMMGKEEPRRYGNAGATPEEHRAEIAAAAEELNQLRERWLNPPEWTIETILEFPGSITGPWSRYVVEPDQNGIGTVRYPRLEARDADCAAKLKERTLTKLYNERPAWLDLAHKKLDAAVSAAYGWPADLTDDQILERLLALNLERADAEAAGAAKAARKSQRAKSEHEMI